MKGGWTTQNTCGMKIKQALMGKVGHPEPSQKGVKTMGDQSPEPQTEKIRNHPQTARRALLFLNIMSMEGLAVDTVGVGVHPHGAAHAHGGDTDDWDYKAEASVQ